MRNLLTLVLLLVAFDLRAEIIHETFNVSYDDCKKRDISRVGFGVCHVKFRETTVFERLVEAPRKTAILPTFSGRFFRVKFKGTKTGYRLDCQKYVNDRVGTIDCTRFEMLDAMKQFLATYPDFHQIQITLVRDE